MNRALTQLDAEGRIVIASLPEPTRSLMQKTIRDRTLGWIVDGDELALSLETYFMLAHWCGSDIELVH
ncbi:hypothetical protein [Roseateles sp.]|uniref:hypothetical protein n=1 Tax=Roseateles sp. TaxID=1971397 RepID=UPI003BA88C26